MLPHYVTPQLNRKPSERCIYMQTNANNHTMNIQSSFIHIITYYTGALYSHAKIFNINPSNSNIFMYT